MAGLMETIEKMQCQICTLFDKFKEQQEEGIVSSINSPNNTIIIGGDGSIVTVDIEESLLNLINESIQPGDNVSELVNDAGYAVLADLHPVATSGSYNDLEDVPTSFPPSAHTHPISDIINLQATLDSKENLANKGLPNGYAALDAGGKIPSSQLPNSVMELQGEWNALTNTPILADGVGNPGDIWKVTTAGTQDLGSGNITFGLNDFVIYGSNGVWFKSDNTDAVNSVFGRIGTVIAQNGDYTASQVTNVPFGNISALTVQAALNELDSEKAIDANVLHKTGDETKTGNLTVNQIIKSGAPSTNILLAGGSDITQASLAPNIDHNSLAGLQLAGAGVTYGHITDGAQTIAGVKSMINTGATQINGLNLTNNGTFGSTSLLVSNASTGSGVALTNYSSGKGIELTLTGGSSGQGIGISNAGAGEGINISNFGTGTGLYIGYSGTGSTQGLLLSNSSTNSVSKGIYSASTSAGTSIYSSISGSGSSIVSNVGTSGTGFAYVGQNNSVNTFTVNKLGVVTGSSFIKSGATATNILLAGGSDIPQSTFVPSTRTISINGVTQDLSTNRSYRAGLSNTGVLTYGGINVGSSTTVNIGAVTGVITDNETTPGTPGYQLVTYAGATNITVPTIGGGTGTYVLLNSSGTIVFQNTFPTSAQRKSMIYLSKISHPNLATISFAIDEPDFVNSPLQQFRDLFQVIQYMNQGVSASGNVGLTINTTNGNIIGDGINFVVDKTNPNMLTVAAGAPRDFLLLNQSGATGSFVTTIDPTNYDVGGTTTLIGGGTNRTTIQYLYYAPGVGFAILRGQTVYSTLLEAVQAVGRESFIVRPNLVNNSILIAAICLRHTTTNMNDTAYVRILPADKFGQIGGASSGISVTNLQTAYNNSLIPQITTSTALGAVTLRNGGALNTDNVFAIQNLAGTVTASINGNGIYTGGANLTGTPTAPTAIAGTSTTQIATTAFVTGNFLDRTTDQSFTGIKSSTNTGTTKINGINLSNNSTGGNSLQVSNNSTGNGIVTANATTGVGIYSSNTLLGNGIQSQNLGGGIGIAVNNFSSGAGISSNGEPGSTGFVYVGKDNNTITFSVAKTGAVTGTSFIKSGATASNILLAGGTDIPQSTFALASGSGNYIQNQTASLQTANFRISGTNSFFGTTNFYNSASSAFPVNYKTPAGSINIVPAINDDINLITSGSGMTTIQGGWGLGFKPVVGLAAGPDFGTNMGGIAYRPPTESMTKNFFIFRGGQYVFEDDGASWKFIITPTGVNVGGGATDVGGLIPVNAFEVHGNTVIGSNYDRVRVAPTNGLLVEGSMGIGTYTPIGKLNILTGAGLTLDVVNQENASISFTNGSAGVTAPLITGKSTNGAGLGLVGVNIDANPNTDMSFTSTRTDGLNYTDLTRSAFRFRLVGSSVISLVDILRNGNVGIGTTSPIAKTHIEVPSSNGSAGADGFRVANGLMGINFGVESTNAYAWIQSALGGIGVKNLALNPNGGNVGIGTTNPTAKLEVNGIAQIGNLSGIGGSLKIQGASGQGVNAFQGVLSLNNGVDPKTWAIVTGVPGAFQEGLAIRNSTDNSTKLYIKDNGNVIINGVNDNGVDKLQVNGNILVGNSATAELKYNSTSTGSVSSMVLRSNVANTSSQIQFLPNGTSTILPALQLFDSSTSAAGCNITLLGRGNSTLPNSGTTYLGSIIAGSANANSFNIGFLVSNTTDGRLESLTIKNTGQVQIAKLSGTGTRTVVADASGNLSTIASASSTLNTRFIITQSGTAAPTVGTYFENNLGGTIVWARTGTGTYTGTLVGAFPSNKIFFMHSNNQVGGAYVQVRINRTSDDVITVETLVTGTLSDNAISGLSVVISRTP